MIRKIGTVIGHLLDDALHIEAQGQVAEGDFVIISGHRVTVGKICCEKSGDTLSVGPGDRFCLPVNFNPDLIPEGTDVWFVGRQGEEILPAGVVSHLFVKIEVLAVQVFEELRPGMKVFLNDLGPFEISSLQVNHETREVVLPRENCGLKLEDLDFSQAKEGAKIFVVSEDGEPAEVEETVTV